MQAMTSAMKKLWCWFWHERLGVFLFPRLRGYRRLVLELPVAFLGAYAWYLYFSSLPVRERNFALSTFGNLFGATAILCIAVHQAGIGYLRSQLPREVNFSSRLALLIPGKVLALYKKQHGEDLTVRILRGIRLAAFVTFAIGMIVVNWARIHS